MRYAAPGGSAMLAAEAGATSPAPWSPKGMFRLGVPRAATGAWPSSGQHYPRIAAAMTPGTRVQLARSSIRVSRRSTTCAVR